MARRKARRLGIPGQRAYDDALAAFQHEPDRLEHAAERYGHAVDREHELRAQWDGLGRPLLTEGGATGRAEVVHPLLERIERAESHAQKLAAEFGLTGISLVSGKRGRPQEQVVPRPVGEPSRVTPLRRVS